MKKLRSRLGKSQSAATKGVVSSDPTPVEYISSSEKLQLIKKFPRLPKEIECTLFPFVPLLDRGLIVRSRPIAEDFHDPKKYVLPSKFEDFLCFDFSVDLHLPTEVRRSKASACKGLIS